MISYRARDITVFQSQLQQTTSTVLVTPDLVLVVDPCWLPEEVETIRQHVEAIRGTRPLYLLFTHADWDHIIGYRAFPDALVIASAAVHTYPEAQRQRKLSAIEDFYSENYIVPPYPVEFPTVDHIIEHEGQQLTIGETTITFYHAHGHTFDGLFTIVEPLGVFLAGDYLSDAEFPFIYYSSTDYERTMHKVEHILQHHEVSLLVPGHGSITEDCGEIRRRQQESLSYIAQVRDCILHDRPEELRTMIEHWTFARTFPRFHQDNINLITRELRP
ncbi:MBL fold metallo-hydrolase [Tumebacillus permanentifrigoris]|uniref:Glyoxylase-like metal-dependent hydrolase (Beta-lactamase superfamily II) n=1 Tax=Tumebacillus permanentifrigoris TaxID=378543 RepID=A0A316DF90_9BACL|nr:MBL fold metallo-hydrolase [Tumebacillus permanentifrigoris]PWK14904.1 glyoxylase-like metal-dependent hydrolase (beta-lactamase superfamily II) [Tumebacillus permanentifrigoris]